VQLAGYVCVDRETGLVRTSVTLIPITGNLMMVVMTPAMFTTSIGIFSNAIVTKIVFSTETAATTRLSFARVREDRQVDQLFYLRAVRQLGNLRQVR